jgi:WD40 repeat protein
MEGNPYVLRYTLTGHKKAISCLSFSPDGKYLASSCKQTASPPSLSLQSGRQDDHRVENVLQYPPLLLLLTSRPDRASLPTSWPQARHQHGLLVLQLQIPLLRLRRHNPRDLGNRHRTLPLPSHPPTPIHSHGTQPVRARP